MIEGAMRLVTDSAGLMTELVGELAGGSSFAAAGTLGCKVAGGLSNASWVSVADARRSGNGGDFVPSLSTGAEITRWAINSAVNEPIGAAVLSEVDAGSMEVARSSEVVDLTLVSVVVVDSTDGCSTGSTAGPISRCSSGSTDIGSIFGIGSRAGGSDSSTGGAAGPISRCSSGSTDIGSVFGIGSRAGGSDLYPDNAWGASATSSDFRLPPCLSSFSSAFLALASRFSSSKQH